MVTTSASLRADLSLTIGGRLLAAHNDTAHRATQGLSVANFRSERSVRGFALRIVLEYTPTSSLLLYAQVAEGYGYGG